MVCSDAFQIARSSACHSGKDITGLDQEQCGSQNTALRFSFVKADIFPKNAIELHSGSACKQEVLDPHVYLVTHTGPQ